MSSIPSPGRILFVGSELQARARLDVAEARGWQVEGHPADALPETLESFDLAVVDLDDAGITGIEGLRDAGFQGRIVGFFSHVDRDLQGRAEEIGIEAYPRGRFWRELERILAV